QLHARAARARGSHEIHRASHARRGGRRGRLRAGVDGLDSHRERRNPAPHEHALRPLPAHRIATRGETDRGRPRTKVGVPVKAPRLSARIRLPPPAEESAPRPPPAPEPERSSAPAAAPTARTTSTPIPAPAPEPIAERAALFRKTPTEVEASRDYDLLEGW